MRWPVVNIRQLKAKKRDKRPQRKKLISGPNIGAYWNSQCELELRYYLGRILHQEFTTTLKSRGFSRTSAFVYRHKRMRVAQFYIRKFNHHCNRSIISAFRIDQQNLRKYRKMVCLSHPCRLCGGCYLTEKNICRTAQGTVLQKYGFFRTMSMLED